MSKQPTFRYTHTHLRAALLEEQNKVTATLTRFNVRDAARIRRWAELTRKAIVEKVIPALRDYEGRDSDVLKRAVLSARKSGDATPRPRDLNIDVLLCAARVQRGPLDYDSARMTLENRLEAIRERIAGLSDVAEDPKGVRFTLEEYRAFVTGK